MQTIIKAALATLSFGVVHSALASRRAKRIAAYVAGREHSEATYRVFYVGQGLISFAALLAYCAKLPRNTVYHVRGPGAILLRAGQLAGLMQLFAGLRQVGFRRWSGVEKLQAWQKGEEMPLAPVAQGPELDEEGKLTGGGPFRWSRHPLNFAAVPLFWLTPHMTTRRLAFNTVGTAYLVLGSLHEEVRLRAAYGPAYELYLQNGPAFFVSKPTPLTKIENHPRHKPGQSANLTA